MAFVCFDRIAGASRGETPLSFHRSVEFSFPFLLRRVLISRSNPSLRRQRHRRLARQTPSTFASSFQYRISQRTELRRQRVCCPPTDDSKTIVPHFTALLTLCNIIEFVINYLKCFSLKPYLCVCVCDTNRHVLFHWFCLTNTNTYAGSSPHE